MMAHAKDPPGLESSEAFLQSTVAASCTLIDHTHFPNFKISKLANQALCMKSVKYTQLSKNTRYMVSKVMFAKKHHIGGLYQSEGGPLNETSQWRLIPI